MLRLTVGGAWVRGSDRGASASGDGEQGFLRGQASDILPGNGYVLMRGKSVSPGFVDVAKATRLHGAI